MHAPDRTTWSAIDGTGQLLISRLLTYFAASSMSLLLPVQAGGIRPVLGEYEQVKMIVSMVPSLPSHHSAAILLIGHPVQIVLN